MRNTASLAVLAAALVGAFGAQAADLAPGPVYTKAPAAIEEWNPWMIRVRAVDVLPDGNSTVYYTGRPDLSSPNTSLRISDQAIPELDISYFFTQNLAAELILGVSRHSITGTGNLAGANIGKTTVLPPTLTFQYHFTQFGAFKPYVGLGVNYSTFFDTKSGSGIAPNRFAIGDSFGAAAQFGFDYMIDRHWGWNVDVKKVWMRPEYSIGNGAITGTAHIDPWLIGTGITYKF
jgi:outer membrane protein